MGFLLCFLISPHLWSIKEPDVSLPSSQSDGSSCKIIFLASTPRLSDLLAYRAATRASLDSVTMRPISLACKWPPSHSVFLRTFVCVYTLLVSLLFLKRTTVLLDFGSTLTTSFNINYPLKALSQAVILGVMCTTYEFCENTIQSI